MIVTCQHVSLVLENVRVYSVLLPGKYRNKTVTHNGRCVVGIERYKPLPIYEGVRL